MLGRLIEPSFVMQIRQCRYPWKIPFAVLAAVLVLTLAGGCRPVDQARSDPGLGEGASVVERMEDGWLVDVAESVGLDFVHQFVHERIANILLSNGSGGAVFDYDGDGWMDLFLVNWGPMEGVTRASGGTQREPNRLYRNQGDGTFADVTREAGLEGAGFGSAAVAGDYDNDGHVDLYVVNIGRNLLYRNRGDGTFEEVSAAAGVGDVGSGISAVWVDVDGDGWLDLFICNYLTYIPEAESEQNPGAYPGPLAYAGEIDVLYRNRGDGTFEDISEEAGIAGRRDRGMAVIAFDVNGDGAQDLYISNDDTPNVLWLNDGRGRFRDVALEWGVAYNAVGEAAGSMNATIGDATGNGFPDLFVTRLGYGSLYLRRPDGFYEDRMWHSGLGELTEPYVGWGGCFIDVDNSGDLDLFIANGSAFDLKPGSLPLLLKNNGRAQFTDAAVLGGAFFNRPLQGRGAAVLDYNNNGRLDLVVTALGGRVVLLENRASTAHHWIKLSLGGTRSNRDGYGALITIRAGGRTWQTQAICPTGFLLQGDKRVHVGLGDAGHVDEIRIRWPSGTVQVLTDIEVDQILQVREPDESHEERFQL
jgi:enediyne biosynthesis protein E4